MSNIFQNDELSFKYPNNWKLVDNGDIKNCIAVLDSDSKFSRLMIFKYPQEGLSLDYLKNAIEDIPREESLIVEKSHLTLIGNKETHELIAHDRSHEPPLKTHSLSTISDRDAFSFNFFSFGLDNPDEEEFLMIYKTLKFE
ncbi:hypothetical protein [Methanobrevibacter olleyae]|uniref:Uncharacterized protein n=1 Tax=Methanobrevibacter olleyae TaxID=294671 RepID=A0A126QYM3_METOL|nr:hypothetical protein [Methanobrevibacter olleyae]AMK14936.1 hypothetical protein YLM1_0376 [Methanobrevibacter olleyae]